MAFHPLLAGLKYNNVYNDVSADVRQSAGFKITRGRGDESAGIKATAVTARLGMQADGVRYDPDHPLSPLYGIVGRNTPFLFGYLVARETFEAVPPYAFAFANGGAASWARANDQAHAGTWSLKSGVITNSQVSDFIITTPARANAVSLYWLVSSQTPGDGLQVFVDGTQWVNNAGVGNTWQRLQVPCLPGGTILLRYTKDAAGSAGSDAAWVDDITFYDSRTNSEVSSWKPNETLGYVPGSRGDRWTDVQCGGVLQRLGQWAKVTRSPMYRNISGRATSGALLGYFPLQDAAGATALANVAPGGVAGVASGVTFATGTPPAGSDPLLALQAVSKVSGRFVKPTGTPNGWVISWVFRTALVAPSEQQVISWITSNGLRWYVTVTSSNYTLYVLSPDGITVLVSHGVIFGAGADPTGAPILMRVKASTSAGVVTAETAWYVQDGPLYGITDTFSGSASTLQSWSSSGNPATAGMMLGHVYAVAGITDDLLTYNTRAAFNGYRGEKAGRRFLRLLQDAGVFASVIGDPDNTLAMGAQKSDTLPNQLKEIEDTDDALIFDDKVYLGVTMRTRASMYNQTPKLALVKSDLVMPLEKKTDDLVTGNVVTVTNRSGSEFTATLLAGAGSVQDPPVGVGEYEKQVKVNVSADSALPGLAGWYLSRWSDVSARYPSISLDLDGKPGLEVAASLIDVGDLITVSGLGPDLVSLIVVGTEETSAGPYRRLITFNTRPATVYAPAVYNGTKRYDALTTTLGVARDAVQVAWTFSSTALGDCWSTTATPYDVAVNGEVVRVTAMGAATGTGPYTQAATVTRGINGAAKAHSVGEQIHVAPYAVARYAL
jgi:hypothetical protein